MRKKVIIMGAAGRDFHNFNILFRTDERYEVMAFTAAQIPFIQNRTYPAELAGPLYPQGIPVYPEERLEELIKESGAGLVIFSYSDVSHEYIMHRASVVTALGADFVLPGAESTMVSSRKPVISVCAVRTGCGKSGVTRFVAGIVKDCGKTPAAVRHPMPYGDLRTQKVQRFSDIEDPALKACTIEEMEEFEPLLRAGVTVYSGIDTEEVVRRAEKEADLIIWDGGNNDMPFVRPDLEICVADPLRPGHELLYYPGEANLRRAGCVVINKANSAPAVGMEIVKENVRAVNPKAEVVLTDSVVTVEGPIKGKRVLVVEDGPTLTHGGMDFGAGIAAAREQGAEPVDPEPHAAGSIRETLKRYPNLKNLVPAMGYSKEQIKELEETINRTPCDVVLIATPVDLAKVMNIKKPTVRVSYEVQDRDGRLEGVIERFLKKTSG